MARGPTLVTVMVRSISRKEPVTEITQMYHNDVSTAYTVKNVNIIIPALLIMGFRLIASGSHRQTPFPASGSTVLIGDESETTAVVKRMVFL